MKVALMRRILVVLLAILATSCALAPFRRSESETWLKGHRRLIRDELHRCDADPRNCGLCFATKTVWSRSRQRCMDERRWSLFGPVNVR